MLLLCFFIFLFFFFRFQVPIVSLRGHPTPRTVKRNKEVVALVGGHFFFWSFNVGRYTLFVSSNIERKASGSAVASTAHCRLCGTLTMCRNFWGCRGQRPLPCGAPRYVRTKSTKLMKSTHIYTGLFICDCAKNVL